MSGQVAARPLSPSLLSYIYLWSAMNKWMLALLSRLVFQKADIVLFVHGHTEYNGCSGSTLSNRLAHFSMSAVVSCFGWNFQKRWRYDNFAKEFRRIWKFLRWELLSCIFFNENLDSKSIVHTAADKREFKVRILTCTLIWVYKNQ